MRVVVVVAAMFFCAPVFAQGVKLPSVTNSIGMELIEIPAGKFTMGSPAGEKNRQASEAQVAVTLTQPFGLGKTEVTRGQWKNVMGSEPVTQAIKLYRAEHGAYPRLSKSYDDLPATDVSFFEAVEFCDTLTEVERKAGKLKADEEYRLPTEAEWEYACRAGTETAFSFGDESKLNAHAWWGGLDLGDSLKGKKKTADESLAPMSIKTLRAGPGNAARERSTYKVGSKKPNPWGLHDMHGNVSEWCSDCYGVLLGGIDPVGQNEGSDRVNRGGSWWYDPGGCRSASRVSVDPSIRSPSLGFRVARSQSAQ